MYRFTSSSDMASPEAWKWKEQILVLSLSQKFLHTQQSFWMQVSFHSGQGHPLQPNANPDERIWSNKSLQRKWYQGNHSTHQHSEYLQYQLLDTVPGVEGCSLRVLQGLQSILNAIQGGFLQFQQLFAIPEDIPWREEKQGWYTQLGCYKLCSTNPEPYSADLRRLVNCLRSLRWSNHNNDQPCRTNLLHWRSKTCDRHCLGEGDFQISNSVLSGLLSLFGSNDNVWVRNLSSSSYLGCEGKHFIFWLCSFVSSAHGSFAPAVALSTVLLVCNCCEITHQWRAGLMRKVSYILRASSKAFFFSRQVGVSSDPIISSRNFW